MRRYDNDPRSESTLVLTGGRKFGKSSFVTIESHPPYQKHSETSKAAAQSMRATSGAKRIEVLHCIADHGPVTDNEICEITGMSGSTVRPRRIELLTAGLIRQAGKSVGANGRWSTAWMVTR